MRNLIEINETTNTVSITVTRRNGDKHTSQVDLDAYNLLLKDRHFWVHAARHRSNRFYLAYRDNGVLKFAHRLIMKHYLSPEFPEVDHRNPEHTLDNRRSNLRVTNRSGQMLNRQNNTGNHNLPTVPAKHWLDTSASCGLRADQKVYMSAWAKLFKVVLSGKAEATKADIIEILATFSEFNATLPERYQQNLEA